MFKKFLDFINETYISTNKSHMNLELNNLGKKLLPFAYYYESVRDIKFYYVLKRINYEEFIKKFNEDDDRVTYLNKYTYKDNKVEGRKKLDIDNIDLYENNFYYYQMIKTLRKEKGKIISYEKEKDTREWVPCLTENNNLHFIIIQNNTNIGTVRLNGYSARTTSGQRAENVLHNKFGWIIQQTKIQNKINFGDDVDILPDKFRKSVLYNIIGQDEELIRDNSELFSFENNVLSKHDLIIPNNNYDESLRNKKIEVKKYSVSSLFTKNTGFLSNEILLAEQLKISNKSQLKKLVELYKYKNPDKDVDILLNNYNRDGGDELSKYFKKNYNGVHIELVNNIKSFYNRRIRYIYEKFEMIDKGDIMKDVYGIYFFNNVTGVDGFLIKIYKDFNKKNISRTLEEQIRDSNRNIVFDWKLDTNSYWGLYRINIVYQVKTDAMRLVWMGENNPHGYKNTFAETFIVGDLETSMQLRNIDNEMDHRPILKNTSKGDIQWSTVDGYWTKYIYETDDKDIGLDVKKGKSRSS